MDLLCDSYLTSKGNCLVEEVTLIECVSNAVSQKSDFQHSTIADSQLCNIDQCYAGEFGDTLQREQ